MKNFKDYIQEAIRPEPRTSEEIRQRAAELLATTKNLTRSSRGRLSRVGRNAYNRILDQINRDLAAQDRAEELGEQTDYTPKNDYEGEMAGSELRNIIDNAKDIESMLKPTTKLEAWVQSKITKANDYINSVRDYLKNTPGSVEEALDPVGQEDADINNDGVVDGTDRYLRKRRAAIAKAMAKRKGRKKHHKKF